MHKKCKITTIASRNSYTAEVDELDLSGDLAPAIDACMDESAIFRATELCRRYVDARATSAMTAVYVISADEIDICKIGIAQSPSHRLVGLQIGNWHNLKIRSLLWVESGGARVEYLAHQAAKEMGIDIRGEWVSSTPREAAELVLKAARYANVPCYDSGVWLKNWGSRIEALLHPSIKKRLLQNKAA